MNIGFEIDDMISTSMQCLTAQADVDKQTVVEEARDVLIKIKAAGHQITLYTRRDVSVGLETEAWLGKNRIPYDRISFNRPHSITLFFANDVRQFIDWDKTKEELVINGVLKRDEKNEGTGTPGGRGTVGDSAGRCEGKKEVEDQSGRADSPEQEKRSGIQVLKQGKSETEDK